MHLAELSWPQVDALSRGTPIVFPVAAQEQHGHHMPLHTDSILLGEIVKRVEAALSDKVVFAPLQWLGNSHHHLDFPGTISASPRTYLDLLTDQVECLFRHGFQRLVFLNGHGGNIVPSSQVAFELRQRYRDRDDLLFLTTTYWDHASPKKEDAGFLQSAIGHACEWETSMMLVIRPDLVGEFLSEPEEPQGDAFKRATRGWTMKDRTERGHIGTPSAASREKGEILLGSFSRGVVTFLQEVCDWDGRSWDPNRPE